MKLMGKVVPPGGWTLKPPPPAMTKTHSEVGCTWVWGAGDPWLQLEGGCCPARPPCQFGQGGQAGGIPRPLAWLDLYGPGVTGVLGQEKDKWFPLPQVRPRQFQASSPPSVEPLLWLRREQAGPGAAWLLPRGGELRRETNPKDSADSQAQRG